MVHIIPIVRAAIIGVSAIAGEASTMAAVPMGLLLLLLLALLILRGTSVMLRRIWCGLSAKRSLGKA